MNLIFIIGKVVSDIKFDFIINGRNLSIARFDIELLDGSVVKCKTYNGIADFCYSKLEMNKDILLKGKIETNNEIEIENISVL